MNLYLKPIKCAVLIVLSAFYIKFVSLYETGNQDDKTATFSHSALFNLDLDNYFKLRNQAFDISQRCNYLKDIESIYDCKRDTITRISSLFSYPSIAFTTYLVSTFVKSNDPYQFVSTSYNWGAFLNYLIFLIFISLMVCRFNDWYAVLAVGITFGLALIPQFVDRNYGLFVLLPRGSAAALWLFGFICIIYNQRVGIILTMIFLPLVHLVNSLFYLPYLIICCFLFALLRVNETKSWLWVTLIGLSILLLTVYARSLLSIPDFAQYWSSEIILNSIVQSTRSVKAQGEYLALIAVLSVFVTFIAYFRARLGDFMELVVLGFGFLFISWFPRIIYEYGVLIGDSASPREIGEIYLRMRPFREHFVQVLVILIFPKLIYMITTQFKYFRFKKNLIDTFSYAANYRLSHKVLIGASPIILVICYLMTLSFQTTIIDAYHALESSTHDLDLFKEKNSINDAINIDTVNPNDQVALHYSMYKALLKQ